MSLYSFCALRRLGALLSIPVAVLFVFFWNRKLLGVPPYDVVGHGIYHCPEYHVLKTLQVSMLNLPSVKPNYSSPTCSTTSLCNLFVKYV